LGPHNDKEPEQIRPLPAARPEVGFLPETVSTMMPEMVGAMIRRYGLRSRPHKAQSKPRAAC